MPIPHLAIPLRLDGTGALAVVEQDSGAEIAQCVAVALATPAGSRSEVPAYGVPRSDFAGPAQAEVLAAVAEWEPRADLDVTVAAAMPAVVAGANSLTELLALVTPNP